MEVLALRLKIRPFRPDDLKELTKFWREMQSNPIVSGDFSLATDENVAKWQQYVMKVHEEDENQVLVAEVDGKVVGYVFFENRAGTALETAYTWASVNDLYVHPAYRRKGIATKLMKHTFDYLKSIGVTHVRLYVMIDNHAAINLYRKFGFKDLQLRMQMHSAGETT